MAERQETAHARSGRMMDLLGLDEEELRYRGLLSREDRAEVTQRCMGCAEAQTCDGWMAAQREGITAAPGYCRNTETFRQLIG